MSVSSSSKINNPKGAGEADVTEATSVHSAPQRKTVEKDVQKDKTIDQYFCEIGQLIILGVLEIKY